MPEHPDSRLTSPHQPAAPGSEVPLTSTVDDPAAVVAPPLPDRLCPYQLGEEIARGGMGAVLRVRDSYLGRDLAVKVLLEKHRGRPDLFRRFLEEAQITGQLQHPGIPPVHEIGRLPDGRPYLAMKLIEGRTLAQLLHERSAPSHDLPRFLQIFEQICQTLGYAHSRGIIHRDLKPSNVMVGAFGEVQVMDWGIAKRLSKASAGRQSWGEEDSRPDGPLAPGQTQPGAVLGTWAYMAPEQARGEIERIDERCDVFGLGAILCMILTDHPPYDRTSARDLATRADLTPALERLGGCGADRELIELATGCLAAEALQRPRDGGAVAKAMARYLVGVQERLLAADRRRAAAEARAEGERKRRRLTALLAVAGILLVAVIGGGFWWNQRLEDERERESHRVEQERMRDKAARLAGTESGVGLALERATTLLGTARGQIDNPEQWRATIEAAKSAVGHAEGLLHSGEPTDELRHRVEEVRAKVAQGDKDRALIVSLDEARMKETAHKDGLYDNTASPPLFAKAFRDYGIDVLTLDPAEAAARLRTTWIREQLMAVLEHWSIITPSDTERERLRQILEIADPDPDSFGNRWRTALRVEDRTTLTKLAEVAESRPLPPTAIINLARGLTWRGAPEAAVRLLRAGQRRHPNDFWLNHETAFALRRGGPVGKQEAVRYDMVAVALARRNSMAHYNLGLSFISAGELDEAILSFRTSLELNPQYANAYTNLGSALLEKGRDDDAVLAYGAALKLDAKDSFAHAGLGRAFHRQGRLEQAIRSYLAALKLDPQDAGTLHNLGRALAADDRGDEALRSLRQALERDHARAQTLARKGNALVAENKTEEGSRCFRAALDLHPCVGSAHVGLGAFFQNQGRLDEAARCFQAALALDPHSGVAHINLGLLARQRGRFAESLTLLRHGRDRLRSDDPRLPRVRQMIKTGEEMAALDRKLLAVLKGDAQPTDPRERMNLGWLCREHKRLYAASARFYTGAFAEKPAFAEDLKSGHRYSAACAAAQAGCGSGEDAVELSQNDRTRLRHQALEWLRADLTLCARLILDEGSPRLGVGMLRAWQNNPAFAGVRERGALDRLPADERGAWGKFWAEVDDLLKKASKAGT
jgi:serine/threonine-protein kinase